MRLDVSHYDIFKENEQSGGLIVQSLLLSNKFIQNGENLNVSMKDRLNDFGVTWCRDLCIKLRFIIEIRGLMMKMKTQLQFIAP